MNETLTHSNSAKHHGNALSPQEVLVCKTSVQSREEALLLTSALDELVGSGRWNFALDDCDRILRIRARRDYLDQVIALFDHHGFCCSELED
jgi:hypothetical protein